VSERGDGKRCDLADYRITKRGGKGVKTLNVTDKAGSLVAIQDVKDGDELMIINKSGIAIRTPVDNLRVMGRATQGVKLIKLNENDEISAVEKIEYIEPAEGEEEGSVEGESTSAESKVEPAEGTENDENQSPESDNSENNEDN